MKLDTSSIQQGFFRCVTVVLHVSSVSGSRTAGFSEPEQLTQHKSKRLIEGFVCNPLLPVIL